MKKHNMMKLSLDQVSKINNEIVVFTIEKFTPYFNHFNKGFRLKVFLETFNDAYLFDYESKFYERTKTIYATSLKQLLDNYFSFNINYLESTLLELEKK